MSSKTLELYAQRARTIEDPSVASGRMIATKFAERRILADVMRKLDVGPHDTLLDVGAGIGTLAIPLSFVTRSVTVVDHADVLARLRARAPLESTIECIPGNFLEMDLGDRQFTRILVYDVLHYMSDIAEVVAFVDKAIALLTPNGKLLVGDVRNDDVLGRVSGTEEGQRYCATWMQAKWATGQEQNRMEAGIGVDPTLVAFGDRELLGLVARARSQGHNAYLLGQDPGLPLWHQREDLLIQRLVPGPPRQMFIVKLSDGTGIVFGLREAQADDCEMYYQWSQDLGVRASSLRPETFTLEEHREWFERKRADVENVRMYVLEREAVEPFGQARYEVVREGRPLWSGGPPALSTNGTAEVSISIDARARGTGMGALLLKMSLEPAKLALGVERIVALVKPDNAASVKAFMGAGYKQTGESERLGQKVMVLEQ